MKIVKSTYIFIIINLFVISNLYAQFDFGFDFSKAGSAGLQFLKIGVGARESGMGEAATGTTSGPNAVFWNAAGIAGAEKNAISFTHSDWFVNSKHYAASVIIPVSDLVIGINALAFKIDDFEETTTLFPGGTGRMVSAGDIAIGLAVAKQFSDHLKIGGQVKYVQETLDDQSFNNILFDIGALYNTGWRNLRLGFSLQHFGADMKMIEKTFRTPLLFRLSATDELVNSEDFTLTLAAELIHPTDNDEIYNFGTEFVLANLFALRAGYRVNKDEGNLSFGAGLLPYSLGFMDVSFDYAFVKYDNVFSDIHRLTIGLAY